jgi:hypothetical protein
VGQDERTELRSDSAAVLGFVAVESQQRLSVRLPRLSGGFQPSLDFHMAGVSLSLFVFVGGRKI